MSTFSDLEYQVECKVERSMDSLDRRFMRGELTQEQYDAEVKALDAWAIAQYETQA